VDSVAAAAERIVTGLAAGRTVFVAGNGGSAATASHMVCDWLATSRMRNNRCARVISLSDNSAMVTALGNDHCFEEIFARQLSALGTVGDVLVLLSVSGESANLIEAARVARASGIEVIAFVGNLGTLVRYCDVVVELGGGDYGYTEDLHLAVNHIVVRMINGGLPRRYRPTTAALADAGQVG
jgi:D-sedoheptulose 7-phosphate isomerase